MVNDVVEWFTKWSPTPTGSGVPCTIHLNYLQPCEGILCGIKCSWDTILKTSMCYVSRKGWAAHSGDIFQFLHVREALTYLTKVFFKRNLGKINGRLFSPWAWRLMFSLLKAKSFGWLKEILIFRTIIIIICIRIESAYKKQYL